MWRADASKFGKPHREVALLLLASFFVVAALVVAIADGGTIPLSTATGDLRFSVPWAWAPARSPPPSPFAPCALAPGRGAPMPETAELRKSLLTAEAIIKAEPQALVFWGKARACA